MPGVFLVSDDMARRNRVLDAIMAMKKPDIETLKRAHAGTA